MKNISVYREKIEQPYRIMFAISLGFFIYALVVARPLEIWQGLGRILTSRSILVTDYLAVGGVGATAMNVAVVGFVSILMLIYAKIKPGGAIIMAWWLTIGFAFFGKNLLNMFPLTIGVWLFAKYSKEPFSSFGLVSLLAACLSPTVSEIAFLGMFSRPVEIALGILMGFFIGFIFPAISASTVRIHQGYDLYNMGAAGGVITTALVAVLRSLGIDVIPVSIWGSGNNIYVIPMLYLLCAGMLCCGLFLGDAKENWKGFLKIHKHSGRLVDDFYFFHKNSVYLNMAAMGFALTTVMWISGMEIHGLAVGAVLTIMGFGTFGKHLNNITPIIIGAVLASMLNQNDLTGPVNTTAILFGTCLAPIAGSFGWGWGIVAGFLHVNIVQHIGTLSSGLNLYNNGFAATFVIIFLLPIITMLRKDRDDES